MALGLMQPSVPPNVTSTGTSTTALPNAITGYENAVAPNATNLGTQTYTPYQGQLTAGLTPQMSDATSMAGGLSGAWKPTMGAATSAYNNVAGMATDPSQSWSSQYKNWMNPYMDQVVGGLTSAANTNFSNNIMPMINSQFIGSGNYNSTGNAAALGLGGAQAQANLNAQVANALQSGYGTGLNAYTQNRFQDIYGGLGAGSGLANVASNTAGLGWGDVGSLYGIGSSNRNIGQQGLTAQKALYDQSTMMPYQMLGAANSAMGQLPWATSVSGTSNAPLPGAGYGPSTLQNVTGGLGALNTIGSTLFGNNGMLSGNNGGWLSGLGNTVGNWFGGGNNNNQQVGSYPPATTDTTSGIDNGNVGSYPPYAAGGGLGSNNG